MFTRRVRITFLIGVALVAFAAAIRLSVSEEAPTGDILAAVIIGLVALIEPLKTLWDWMGEERQKESEDELLRKLMGNVRRAWIDGILADALRDAQIDIAVAPTPERAGQSGRYADYQAATSSAQTGLWGYIKLRFRKGKETANALANTPDEVVQTFHATDEKL
jgi:hypothetical protein